jgi:catechol 2,3-dioxygenase-like lactoylglutathione lyase family enzyme
MALHGLANMTLGVPDVPATTEFYRDFGLSESAGQSAQGASLQGASAQGASELRSSDGGQQLRVVTRPYRQLVEFTLAADNPDDVERIRAAATRHGVAVTNEADGSISVVEPIMNTRIRVAVTPRIEQKQFVSPAQNAPGRMSRSNDRAPAIFHEGGVSPRRLGHVLYGTPDFEGSQRFLIDVLGFRLSDTSPGIISFLRCSADHHNVGLATAPVPFFHHSSWQVDDVDAIGQGARHLLETDPNRSVWGLGRHFLGSNFFWYFRDPAGNYAEYFADLDQIPDDDVWVAKSWDPAKSLYAWGPNPPSDFVHPADLSEIAEAMKVAAS